MEYSWSSLLIEERKEAGKGERTFSFFDKEGKSLLGEVSLRDIGEKGAFLHVPCARGRTLREEGLPFLLFLLFLREGKEFLLGGGDLPLLSKAGFLPRRKALRPTREGVFREGRILALARKDWLLSLKGKCSLRMEDGLYPLRKEGWEARPRIVARGLILDEEGRLLLHEVKRDDIFGQEGYLETPGGGVDRGETLPEALRRECQEELGRDVLPLLYLGSVEDEYRVIGRRNISHFFLARAVGEKEPLHMVSRGDSLIQRTIALPPKEALSLTRERNREGKVGSLVRNREEPFLSLLALLPENAPLLLKAPLGRG